MTKLSASQIADLRMLRDRGPETAVAVFGPPAMDGKKKPRLVDCSMNIRTMKALEDGGFISVARSEPYRPKDATGRLGNKRVSVVISITAAGIAALD